jgi:hypothetical protein
MTLLRRILNAYRRWTVKASYRHSLYETMRLAKTLTHPGDTFELIDFIEKFKSGSFTSGYRYQVAYPEPNKNLRVALCLSGFLRTFQETAPAIKKHIVDRYNADIFIFSPEEQNPSPSFCHSRLSDLYGADRIKACVLRPYEEDRFDEIVKKHDLKPEFHNRDVRRTLSAFYQIQQSNHLKSQYEQDQGFRYDVVIKTRHDLGVYSPLVLEGEDFDEKTVYFPEFTEFTKREGKRVHRLIPVFPYRNLTLGEYISASEVFFNDYINISSSQSADIMANAYDHLPSYIVRGVLSNPETLMAYHLCHAHGLAIEMRDFITCNLHRPRDPLVFNPFLKDPAWFPHRKFKEQKI